MQLRQSKALGVFDDHDVGIGHIDADLDDGGGDQNLQLIAAKILHHRHFFRCGHLAVQQPDLILRIDLLGQFFCQGRGILQIHFFRFLDQRADNIGLMPLSQFFANEAIHPLPLAFAHMIGDDGLAARRQFVDHRQIQIAVNGQCQRAWDRCSRHHQHIRT